MQESSMIFKPRAALSHIPSQPVSIPSPRGLISRDSCLQLDTRNSFGTSGHVFEDLIASGEPPGSNLWKFEKIPTPRFVRKFSTWNPPLTLKELIRKLYGWTTEESSLRNAFRKSPWSFYVSVLEDEFQDRSMFLFRFLTDTMLWIKELEMTKSVGDLMTSLSTRRYKFPNFEMLDAKIASALQRIISNPFFNRRVPRTDFFEEDRLLAWSTNISELLALMMLFLI